MIVSLMCYSIKRYQVFRLLEIELFYFSYLGCSFVCRTESNTLWFTYSSCIIFKNLWSLVIQSCEWIQNLVFGVMTATSRICYSIITIINNLCIIVTAQFNMLSLIDFHILSAY